MCKTDTTARRQGYKVLLSVDSFSSGTGTNKSPEISSCCVTVLAMIGFLVAFEQVGRHLFATYQDAHPILEDETNRQILARHVFVDSLACVLCAAMGWASRNWSLYPVVQNTIPKAGWEQRLFTYNPAAFRLALFFFSYQVKNLVDCVVWSDGPEYIFHHVFSLITAWGCMFPGCGHMYAMFFFGASEISTAVLCVLANFDDHHGVPGLGEALPLPKVVIGAAFVVLFLLCRCILWPWASYYFCRDILAALKSDDPRAKQRKSWMTFFLVSLSGLSVLQIAWLGQIGIIAKVELAKAGFL